jgi:hypothetical protein
MSASPSCSRVNTAAFAAAGFSALRSDYVGLGSPASPEPVFVCRRFASVDLGVFGVSGVAGSSPAPSIKEGTEMSFFDVSLETANKFYVWGWRGSLAGAVVTAVAVVFLMWGTHIRDRDFEAQLASRMPRTISLQQHDLIVELLSPERIVKGPVLVNTLMDGESWQFGDRISATLKDAGFDPKRVDFGQQLVGLSLPGAFLWIKDMKKQPKHGGPIFEAFKRAGIILVGEEKPDVVQDTDTVEIVVGSHP